MPTYQYECSHCNNQWDKMYSISSRKTPETLPCPFCQEVNTVSQVVLSAPSIGDAVRLGVVKSDGGFKEVLQKIDSRAAGSRLKENSTLTKL